MVKKKETVNKSPRPLLLTLIAYYFIFAGFINIVGLLILVSFSFPNLYNILNNFRFLYAPGIPYDPFTQAVVSSIAIYSDMFIYLKAIFAILLFFFAAYTILRRKRTGLYLGLFISISGLVLGTSFGLQHNPIWYIQNIFNGITTSGTNDLSWIYMLLTLSIVLFIPFYLYFNRKLFTK